MVLDTSLFNTYHYKVRIKGNGLIQGKVKQPLLHLGVVAIEKGAFGPPSTTTVFVILTTYVYIYQILKVLF